MPTFAHVLTSIPQGSKVLVKARARFTQFDEVVNSGAIAIIGDEMCYPIRVIIRPYVYGNTTRGGMKVVVDMGSEWTENTGVPRGGTYDILITDVLQFNPGKMRLFTPFVQKVGPFLTCAAVRATPSPVTDVYNVIRCEGCSAELSEMGKTCRNCQIKSITCDNLRLGSITPERCGNPLVENYGACKEHLEFMGITPATRKFNAYTRERKPRLKACGRGPDKPVKIVLAGEEIEPVVAPIPVPPPPPNPRPPCPPKEARARRTYTHTASYYEKRGIAPPRDNDPRQLALPLAEVRV